MSKAPPTARGRWATRGMTDWNHASELLKQHNDSMWHRDSVIVSKMAAQPSVIELHNAQVLHEAEERRARNRVILTKLLRSVHFLTKNRIPHTTTYSALVNLQIANSDEVLQQHVTSGPSNAQYTSSFSCRSFLAAIDKWLDQKLTKSLMSSPYFSILADECEDVATCEELSICCRWLVGGKPEEHFMTILHVTATDAATITVTGSVKIECMSRVGMHSGLNTISPSRKDSSTILCLSYKFLVVQLLVQYETT